MRRRRLLVTGAIAFAVNCSGTPTGPTTPPAPTPPVSPGPPARVVTGTIVDAVNGNPQSNLHVTVDGVGNGTTDDSGTFSVETPAGFANTATIRVQGPNIVSRTSRVKVPGGPVALSTMQNGFALEAFDQMFRHSGPLTRWPNAPRLVLQRRVLQFTTPNATSYTAADDIITDAQAAELLSTLLAALPALTGGRFTAFANEVSDTANPGDTVSVLRGGDIFVAHFEGLSASSAVAYGRWASDSRSNVRGGIIMLDRDFDVSGARRRAVRAHELGHALGYNHVTTRESVMNTSPVEPTQWDRDASNVAFQREPGNRSPDEDPVWFTSNPIADGRFVWSPAIP